MKHMNKEELKAYGDTLPLGEAYDARCYVVAFKNSNGYWYELVYDAQGKESSFKDSEGNWRGVSNEDIDKERARLKQVRKNLKQSKK